MRLFLFLAFAALINSLTALADTLPLEDFVREVIERSGYKNMLIEGGAGLAGSALDAGAVDRVEFHIAPKILGGRSSLAAVGGKDPVRMADARLLKNIRVCRYGDDIAVSGDLKG